MASAYKVERKHDRGAWSWVITDAATGVQVPGTHKYGDSKREDAEFLSALLNTAYQSGRIAALSE